MGDKRQMRLEQLYYLVEVAKTKSISLTAERIYVSQPSITDAIKKLEQEFDVTLLARSNRGVSLTEAGEKVVQTSRQVLEMMDHLKSELEVYKEKKAPDITGRISIFATPDIAYTILPDVLNVFCKRYPQVSTVVKESDIFNVLEAVRDDHADLGLISMVENLMEKNSVSHMISNEMYFEKLSVSDLYALVSSSSPLAAKKSISLKQVLKYPLVFYSTHTADCWVEIFKNYGTPNIYLKSNSIEVYLNAIMKDLAVGFIGDLYLNHVNIEGIKTIPVKEEVKGVVGWARPNHDQFSPAAQAFVKVLKSQC